MKNNDENKKDLNYKDAYYYLFNKVTDIIGALQIAQRKAEEICINETKPDNIEINIEEIIKNIADIIKEENNDTKEIKQNAIGN